MFLFTALIIMFLKIWLHILCSYKRITTLNSITSCSIYKRNLYLNQYLKLKILEKNYTFFLFFIVAKAACAISGMSRERSAYPQVTQRRPEMRTNENLEPVAILNICFIAFDDIATAIGLSVCLNHLPFPTITAENNSELKNYTTDN